MSLIDASSPRRKSQRILTRHNASARTFGGNALPSEMLALEPRVMLDGAIAMAAVDQADSNPAGQDDQAAQVKEPAVQSNTDSEAGNNTASDNGDGAGDAIAPADRIIIIVDAAVADAQDLLAGVDPSAEIFYLSGDTDGIHQITSLLAGETGIAELHILSHGETGSVTLGNTVLSAANAETYASEFTVWDSALNDGADILLYGCNIGEDAAGKAFLDLMADLTNADLAASDDLTGGAGLGGNWDLEVATGTIEAGLPLSTASIDGYAHTLLFVPTNTAPSLTDLTMSATVLERDAPVVLDSDVTVGDQEQNWDGGVLTISGLAADDVLAVQSLGNAAGETSVSGNTISVGGTVVGSFTGGSAGADLVITFNGDANNAAVERVIENLVFSNGSDTPVASRTLSLTLVDGGGMEARGTTQTLTEQTGADNPVNGISVGNAAAPAFVDIDADGDLDVFVGSVNGDVRFFRNTGSPQAPSYTEETGTDNPLDGVSVTFDASPTFVDIDNNGVLDAFVAQQDGSIFFYQNTGTDTAPVFVRVDGAGNPFNGENGGFLASPTFVDIDNDGDFDAFVGRFGGSVAFYENTGDPDAPSFSLVTGADDPFNGFNAGLISKPDFVDFDGDGDFDAIVGSLDANFNGALTYLRNDGDPDNPNLTVVTGPADPFDPLTVQTEARPAFADIDGDGDPDLFVGGFDGTIAFFETDTRFDIAVDVTAVNSTPVVTPPAGPLAATEQVDLAIHGTGFSADDPDTAGGPATVTLAVGEGTLTVDVGNSGVSIVSGNGSQSVELEGTLSQINALLGGTGTGTILYRSISGSPSPSTTISVTYNDRGETGIDPGLTADDTSEEGTASQTITIETDNEPPVVDADAETVAFTERDGSNNPGNLGGLQFLSGVDFTVTDADSSTFSVITISLADTSGNAVDGDTLRVRPQDHGGALRDKLINATITGNNSSNVITVTAGVAESFTAAEVEAILEELRLRIAEDSPAGPATRDLSITVSDTGTPAATSDPLVLQVQVTGVNDTPAWERQGRFPDAQAFTDEDTPLTDVFQSARDYHTTNTSNLSQFQLQDRDDDTGETGGTPERLTLRVDNGTLTFTPGSGVTLVSGNGTNEVVVEGSIVALRNFVNSNGSANLAYSPNADFNGVDTLTMSVNDQGDLPIVGNAKTSTDRTVLISVDPVNDRPVVTADTDSVDVVEIDGRNNVRGGPQFLSDVTFTVTDPDSTFFNRIVVSIVDSGSGDPVDDDTLRVRPADHQGELRAKLNAATITGNNTSNTLFIAAGPGELFTAADVEAILQELRLGIAENSPEGPATRDLVISVGDAGDNAGNFPAISRNLTLEVNVTGVNDTPAWERENRFPDARATTDEDTPLTDVFEQVRGNHQNDSSTTTNQFRLTDRDDDTREPNGTPEQLTLRVENGTLTFTEGSGVTLVSGNGTNEVVVEGRIGVLNRFVNGLGNANLDYAPNQDFNGTDTLTMTVTDQGDLPIVGNVKTSTERTVEITVDPVNDAPVVVSDTEGVEFTEIDGSNNPGNLGGPQFLTGVDFTVTDVDSSTFSVITISITDTNGNAVDDDTLRVRPQDHGGTGTALRDKLDNATITGNNSSNVITVTAGPGESFTAAEVEAILEELRLRIAEDSPAGPAIRDLTITVADTGDGLGNEPATSEPLVLQVDVSGVNDTPAWERQNRFPDAQAFTDEDTPLTDVFQSARDYHTANTSNLSQFQLQDRDDDTNVTGGTPEQLTLRVENGVLNFTDGSGVTLVSGNGTNEVVVEGSITALRNFVNANGSANLTYSPNTDFNGVDTLTMSVTDQGDLPIVGNVKTSSDRTVLINVGPVNDAPVIVADTEGVEFTEIDGSNNPGNLGGPQFLTGVDFTITDVDSTAFTVITISITNTIGNAVDGDTLRVRPQDHGSTGTALRDKLDNATITGSNSSNVITVTAGPGETFTAEEVEAILQELRLRIAEDTPAGPAPRDLSITVADNGDGQGNEPATSEPLVLQVDVSGVNDTPAWERQDRFPDAQAFTDEDTPLTDVFQSARDYHTANTSNLSQFQLQDRDDDTNVTGGTPEQLTLRVENGVLNFTDGGGVTLVSGNGTNEVVVEGSISALRNFVNANGSANLTYSPNANFNGVDTLTMSVTDQGDLPIEGNVRTSTDRTVLINVDPVNDAPVNSMPEPQIMNEDSTLLLSVLNGNGISVADIDAGNGDLTTIVSVTTGALDLSEGGGATIAGNGGSIVTVTGTLDEINAALASITYTPPADFNGAVTLTVETSDGGNTGKGGPLTDTDTVAITVNPVNDQPVNTMPSAQTTPDDTPLVFSPSSGNGLFVSDIDAGNGVMTTTVTVTSGSLSASSGGGAAIGGNGTATVVISGTSAQINAALAGLTFTPVDVGSSSATVVLSMTTNDNGNTGIGGPLSATNQISITVDGALVSPGPDDGPDPIQNPDDTPPSETDGLFDGDPLDVGQLPAGPALFDDLGPFGGGTPVDPIITAGIGGEPPVFGNPFDPDNLPGNIDLVRESDTGRFDNDDITRDNTPALTGSAPADTRVVITSSIGGVIGTAETDENGVWRLQAPEMADGAHELIATPIDEEGSEGTASVPLLVIIDTQAPETPPAPALDGEIDQLKANEQVPLNGTSEPGARIVVTSDKDGVVGEVVADENGNWSLVIAPLTEGNHALQVTATDVAGNSSAASPALSLTVLPEDDAASLGTDGSQDLASLLSGFTGSGGAALPANVEIASNPGAVGFTRQVQLAGL